MGRETQVIPRHMRKERKDGGSTEMETAWGEGGGERLRGTGDERERQRSRGKKEKGGTERERQTEVGKGRREDAVSFSRGSS